MGLTIDHGRGPAPRSSPGQARRRVARRRGHRQGSELPVWTREYATSAASARSGKAALGSTRPRSRTRTRLRNIRTGRPSKTACAPVARGTPCATRSGRRRRTIGLTPRFHTVAVTPTSSLRPATATFTWVIAFAPGPQPSAFARATAAPIATAPCAPSQLLLLVIPPTIACAFSAWARADASWPRSPATSASVHRAHAYPGDRRAASGCSTARDASTQVRSVKTTPIVPYSLPSSMITDEK